MNLDLKWVPMKWPCGPLEFARRSKSKGAGAELKETLDAWTQPDALDLLKGTPVNCLVVEWADGAPEDSAQQQALKPLLEAGRQRGIGFVGKIAAGQGTATAVASARSAGLSAVMLAEAGDSTFDLPAIVQSPRDKIAWGSVTPVFCTTDNDWPGLRLETMHGDTAVAGPTGVPWVNSNAWFSMLSDQMAPGKTRWLDFDPPDISNLAHPANYPLAVADSEAFGSHWIISLDDSVRSALVKGNPQAQSVWKKTCETLTFFQGHREWQKFQPHGVLAVVSSYLGDNGAQAGEVLNLLNRRQVQFQVMERSKALAKPAPGLKAILWVDSDAPAGRPAPEVAGLRPPGRTADCLSLLGALGSRANKKRSLVCVQNV